MGVASGGARARARADDAGCRVHRRRTARSPYPAAHGNRTISTTRRALAAALGRLHGRGLIHKDIKPANVLVDSATGQVWLTGFGICISPPARAPVARTSRVHRGNARLYGARANGTSESLYRFSQRPLLTWNHVLRNADRHSSVHGIRSDGMGALSYCETTCIAQRSSEECPDRRLRNHHEVALQDRRGAISDGGGCRERSSALPLGMGDPWARRRFRAGQITTLRIA